MDPESTLSRRRLLQSGVAAGTLLLAGCGSDGGNRTASPARTTRRSPEPTATSTEADSGIETASTRPTVPLGEAVADNTVAMVLQGASKRSEIGGRTASSDNEFVVAFLAVKNRTDDTFVSAKDLDTFRLVTDDGSYDRVPVPTEPGSQFRGGLIAPGEVIRGYLVFEAPPGISSPAVEVDVESGLSTSNGCLPARRQGRRRGHLRADASRAGRRRRRERHRQRDDCLRHRLPYRRRHR